MKKKKSLFLHVPSEIKIKIDKVFSLNHEIYYFILDQLIVNLTIKKPSDERLVIKNYVNINRRLIKKIIRKEPYYYIKKLTDQKILISDCEYKKGIKSFHYKINTEQFKIDNNTVEIKHTHWLHKGILNHHKNSRSNINKLPYHEYQMAKKLFNVKYDAKGARLWIQRNKENLTKMQELSYYSSIQNFADQRLRRIHKNKTNNRVDTNLTNMKKEFRSFLVDEYDEIDLKNSQPYLLAITLFSAFNPYHNNHKLRKKYQAKLKKHFRESKINNLINIFFGKNTTKSEKKLNLEKNPSHNLEDNNFFEDFLNKTLNGTLYEYLSEVCKKLGFTESFTENGEINRDKIKVEVIFKLLYGWPSKKHKINHEREIIFDEAFPIIREIIETLKLHENNKLAIFLQKLESYIFIDKIVKKLVDADIIPLTIHDSVLVNPKDSKKAKKIMEEVFMEETGHIPNFHISRV